MKTALMLTIPAVAAVLLAGATYVHSTNRRPVMPEVVSTFERHKADEARR